MSRTARDITEAELAILQQLWDSGPSTIRQITDDLYPDGGASSYATVQKLLDRLDTKGAVDRDRSRTPHVFVASLGRDDLIDRRLQEMANQLCGGSLAPLLSHLVKKEALTDRDRATLRDLVERLDRDDGQAS